MNITVHIQRLVLDGLPITSGQGPLVQAAVEAELARLLAAGGVTADLIGGGARPAVPAGGVELSSEGDPAALGRNIAQAVYVGIGRPANGRS